MADGRKYRIFNYSRFKQNDRRIYNLFGYSIPGGIDVILLVSAVIGAVVVNMIALPIFHAFGVKYFDLKNGKYMLGTLMIILPMVAGGAISKAKIAGIPLYSYITEFIKYIIKPKNKSLQGEKCSDKAVHMRLGVDDPI